ncbi:MAG: PP2C family protein-serine/threonine phosphatase [bacterium]
MSKISISIKTYKSNAHEFNEDHASWQLPEDPEKFNEFGVLFVLIDGYGGRKSAEVSSNYIAQNIFETYFSITGNITTKDRLIQTFHLVNEKFYRNWKENKDRRGIGASVSLTVLKSHSAVVANVGDSRCYLIRNRTLKQITEDHTWIAEHHDVALTDRSFKNILTRSLGSQPTVKVDVHSIKINPDDLFLMITDGIYDFVDQREVRETALYRPPEEATSSIINYAIRNQSSDNATIMLVKIPDIPISYESIPQSKIGAKEVEDQEEIENIASNLQQKTDQIEPPVDEGQDEFQQTTSPEDKSFPVKKFIGVLLLFFLAVVLFLIFNPFRSKNQSSGPIDQNQDTVVSAPDSVIRDSTGSTILKSDTCLDIFLINTAKIQGLANSSWSYLNPYFYHYVDTSEIKLNYFLTNGFSFDSLISVIYQYQPVDSNYSYIDSLLNINFNGFTFKIKPLHIILDVGNDLENTGNFIADTITLENIYMDTLNIVIISRYPNDSVSLRLAEQLQNKDLNNISVNIAVVMDPVDTVFQNQTKISSSQYNSIIARSLSYSLGLNAEMYTWVDSIPKLFWCLNQDFSIHLENQ